MFWGVLGSIWGADGDLVGALGGGPGLQEVDAFSSLAEVGGGC